MAKLQSLVRVSQSVKPLLYELILMIQPPYGATRGVAVRPEGRIDRRNSDPSVHETFRRVEKEFLTKVTQILKLESSGELNIPKFDNGQIYFIDYVVHADYISIGLSVQHGQKQDELPKEVSYAFTFMFAN